jgi:hypothetical protein
LCLQDYWDIRQLADSIPVCHRPFLFVVEASAKAILVIALKLRHLISDVRRLADNRSTDGKQTLNGLFYLIADEMILRISDPFTRISELFSPPAGGLRDE